MYYVQTSYKMVYVASSDKIFFSVIKKEVTCSMVVLALLSSEALCPSPPEKKTQNKKPQLIK